jgi:NAD+ synthase
MFDAEKVKNDCIKWIKEWFEQNGKDCNAVIGISGGKDSTVTAGLLVEALGKDRVIGVLMPNGQQSDIGDAVRVCDYLNIRFTVQNIRAIYEEFLRNLEYPIHGNMYRIKQTEQTKINLPPRIRMATLYAISQSVNGRVVCTDNLSESYIGYSTRWGDNVGDFSPLLQLTSDEVVAIGDALGLPYELTHKTPSDGLKSITVPRAQLAPNALHFI